MQHDWQLGRIPARVSWSNAPRSETRQWRSLRPGAPRDEFIASDCTSLQQRGSVHGRDGGGRAQNVLSHSVPLAKLALLLDWSYITGQPSPHALRLGPVFLDAHHADPQSFDVQNTRAMVTFYFGARVLPCRRHQCMLHPCHERHPCFSCRGAKPAGGMQAWHEGARHGSLQGWHRLAKSFPPQQSSIVSCAPAAGPN